MQVDPVMGDRIPQLLLRQVAAESEVPLRLRGDQQVAVDAEDVDADVRSDERDQVGADQAARRTGSLTTNAARSRSPT